MWILLRPLRRIMDIRSLHEQSNRYNQQPLSPRLLSKLLPSKLLPSKLLPSKLLLSKQSLLIPAHRKPLQQRH